jgi:hypothetical protein
MTYENDKFAKYLAMRVKENQKDPDKGISYEKAITSTKTSKEAIDWWLNQTTEE